MPHVRVRSSYRSGPKRRALSPSGISERSFAVLPILFSCIRTRFGGLSEMWPASSCSSPVYHWRASPRKARGEIPSSVNANRR
jgi:hypothetical protein